MFGSGIGEASITICYQSGAIYTSVYLIRSIVLLPISVVVTSITCYGKISRILRTLSTVIYTLIAKLTLTIVLLVHNIGWFIALGAVHFICRLILSA